MMVGKSFPAAVHDLYATNVGYELPSILRLHISRSGKLCRFSKADIMRN